MTTCRSCQDHINTLNRLLFSRWNRWKTFKVASKAVFCPKCSDIINKIASRLEEDFFNYLEKGNPYSFLAMSVFLDACASGSIRTYHLEKKLKEYPEIVIDSIIYWYQNDGNSMPPLIENGTKVFKKRYCSHIKPEDDQLGQKLPKCIAKNEKAWINKRFKESREFLLDTLLFNDSQAIAKNLESKGVDLSKFLVLNFLSDTGNLFSNHHIIYAMYTLRKPHLIPHLITFLVEVEKGTSLDITGEGGGDGAEAEVSRNKNRYFVSVGKFRDYAIENGFHWPDNLRYI